MQDYFLLYETSESYLLKMIEEELREQGIFPIIQTGDLGGIHGGLGKIHFSKIFVHLNEKEKAYEILQIFVKKE